MDENSQIAMFQKGVEILPPYTCPQCGKRVEVNIHTYDSCDGNSYADVLLGCGFKLSGQRNVIIDIDEIRAGDVHIRGVGPVNHVYQMHRRGAPLVFITATAPIAVNPSFDEMTRDGGGN